MGVSAQAPKTAGLWRECGGTHPIGYDMNSVDYLKEVAYIGKIDINGSQYQVYKSKYDDSYITHIGMEDHIQYLADREITDQLTHGVGFSPKENKWYGWSHRAIYGFTIGSTCKKGDCHYRAASEDDELEAAIRFWSEGERINVAAKKVKDGELYVSWKYTEDVKNKKLRGNISGVSWTYDTNFGNGEWIAKTMEDAKEMAVDFNKGVS